MLAKRVIWFTVLTFLHAEAMHAQESYEIDSLVSEFYNNFVSKESNKEVKENIERLLERYPENPYLYNFWASVEWILMGRELGLKLNETKNISKDSAYTKRIAIYERMIEKGLLESAKLSDEEKSLSKAALLFEKSKLQYRFFEDIKSADKTSAAVIQILENTSSCHKYFFLGSIRFSLSNQSKAKQLAIYFLSDSYEELYKLDSDVFNKEKSIEWLKRAYECGYSAVKHKNIWIETAFILINAYANYRRGLSLDNELVIIKKEMAISHALALMFPQNEDLLYLHKYNGVRQKVLENYLKK